jgi:hypothetical protein
MLDEPLRHLGSSFGKLEKPNEKKNNENAFQHSGYNELLECM